MKLFTSDLHCGVHLDGLLGAGSVIVDLGALLTALLAPGEVGNRDDEEAAKILATIPNNAIDHFFLPVGVIGDTGEGIVPCEESSKQTEETSSLDAAGHGLSRASLHVTNSKHQESKIEGKEQQEECHSRAQGTDQQDEGENEPADQVKPERVEEWRFIAGAESKSLLDLESARCENDSERKPEATIRGQSCSTESVSDGHFPWVVH